MQNEYPRPLLMIDVVLFTLKEGQLHVALLTRDNPAEPFHGAHALPGGFVHVQEDADAHATAARVLKEKLGVEGAFLEQLATYTGAGRDPRGWSASIAYYALVAEHRLASQDAVRWYAVTDRVIANLAFDHSRILQDALARLRSKTSYSSLPIHLMPETFTMTELRSVYEKVLDCKLEPRSFARRIEDMEVLTLTGENAVEGGRPARTYRIAKSAQLAQLKPALGFSVRG